MIAANVSVACTASTHAGVLIMLTRDCYRLKVEVFVVLIRDVVRLVASGKTTPKLSMLLAIRAGLEEVLDELCESQFTYIGHGSRF